MSSAAGPRALPAPFADLEPHAADWALADEVDRYHKRHTSRYADAKAFYDAVKPRMGEIAAYLDGFPLAGLDPAQQRLLNLGLMCQELFPAVELFKDVHVPQTYPWDKFYVTSPRTTPPARDDE